MSRSAIEGVAAVLALGAMLGACSDVYTARRDTLSLAAGDDIATNKVTHMIDPWPPYSANRNIAFDGQRMQSAVERYRTNRVTPPVNITTSSANYQQAQQAAAAATNAK
jgi:hypothetical protein